MQVVPQGQAGGIGVPYNLPLFNRLAHFDCKIVQMPVEGEYPVPVVDDDRVPVDL